MTDPQKDAQPSAYDDHAVHARVERWERRWLAVAGFLSLMFVMLIAYSLWVEGAHIAQRSSRAQPEVITSSALFEQPGVRALALNKYQVSVVAYTYSFQPSEIILPVGADVDFFLTSRDVIHGFQILDTNINVEVVPGEVSTFSYTFDEPGEYRFLCNQYCGVGHQNMMAVVRVLQPPAYAAATSEALANQGGGLEVGADTTGSGEGVYSVNCASCHQPDGSGMAGIWPPLTEHAARLHNADRDYLPQLLLYGLQGQINALGESYSGQMPAWRQLGNDEIAEVLNYIVTAWDNEALLEDFTPYTEEDVAPFRDRGLAPDDVYGLRQGLELP